MDGVTFFIFNEINTQPGQTSWIGFSGTPGHGCVYGFVVRLICEGADWTLNVWCSLRGEQGSQILEGVEGTTIIMCDPFSITFDGCVIGSSGGQCCTGHVAITVQDETPAPPRHGLAAAPLAAQRCCG
jgi:hypothetical protein